MNRWNFSPKKILHFLKGEAEDPAEPRQNHEMKMAREPLKPDQPGEQPGEQPGRSDSRPYSPGKKPGLPSAGSSSGKEHRQGSGPANSGDRRAAKEQGGSCQGHPQQAGTSCPGHSCSSSSRKETGQSGKSGEAGGAAGQFSSARPGSCPSGGSLPNYLENNLIRFVYLLRAEGIRIGSSEVIDALQALEHIPIERRQEVRGALKATLIKKSEDQPLFDHSFDHFFTALEAREEYRQHRQQKLEQHEQQMQEAEEIFNFRGEQMELTEMEKTVYAYMPEREKQRLQEFMEMNKSRDTLKREYRPFLESLVKGRLNFWHRQLNREIKENVAREDIGDEELNSIRDAMGSGSQQGGNSILTEDMQYIARKDLPQATMLIRKMARLLVTRISRRYRVTRKQNRLDLRATIRSSIQYGGAPFKLRYKSHRIRKPRLLLLCDVSGSMVRYTSFVLQFIYGLNTAVQRIESFIFSDNVERVTPYFQQGQDFNQTMASLVRESSEWGGGTSLHKALRTLLLDYSEELTRNTIVIIVSDTRTIRHRDALEELKKMREQVKEILWLNTLPEEEWEKYSTVAAFQKTATMFPCNTLSDLEQVMSKKLLA